LSRIVSGVITVPLPSNRRPTFARVGPRGNVFTKSLPGNGFIRHNIYIYIYIYIYINTVQFYIQLLTLLAESPLSPCFHVNSTFVRLYRSLLKRFVFNVSLEGSTKFVGLILLSSVTVH
jgi:hypothetical protein